MSSHALARGVAPAASVDTSILRRSHRSGPASRAPASGMVDSVLRGPGQSLDPATRDFMQAGFRHDFSGVRVHADAPAARSAEAMHARAYTVGRDIVFGRGSYAPHHRDGRRLIAHELTHVVQNETAPAHGSSLREVSAPHDASEREADDVSQRVADRHPARVTATPAGIVQRDDLGTGLGIAGGVLGAVGLGFGIAALAGAFDSNSFSDKELQEYLDGLDKNRKIEGGTKGDNKARAVVRRFKEGAAGFTVLTIPIRILLIQEMSGGYLSTEDQDAILDLLTEAIPVERARLFPAIGIDALRARFDAEQRKKLDALIDEQDVASIGMGGEWTVAETKKINERHGDGDVLKRVLSAGFKIFRFEAAFDKWRYHADGRIEENEVTGLQGNTDRRTVPKRIRLHKNLTNENAARTLYHESDHALAPEPTTDAEYLEGEVQARVKGEEFGDRHGLPEYEKGYRTKKGKPDVGAIRADVTGSDHYNPSTRDRIGRRYQGETLTAGWDT